ncbi:MAG: hypothetical protein ACI9KS_000565 [Sulfitobacter sp.]|jgi:hypothetical protein
MMILTATSFTEGHTAAAHHGNAVGEEPETALCTLNENARAVGTKAVSPSI